MHMFDMSQAPEDLLLLAEADYMGCLPTEDYSATRRHLQSKLEQYRNLMEKPCVQGADLIAEGIAPGPALGAALEHAHKLRLAGVDKASALAQTLGYIRAGGK